MVMKERAHESISKNSKFMVMIIFRNKMSVKKGKESYKKSSIKQAQTFDYSKKSKETDGNQSKGN
jgi:hypothetical protein